MPLAIAIFPNRIEAMLTASGHPPRFLEFPIPEDCIDPATHLVRTPEKLGALIRLELKVQRLYQKKAYIGIPGAIVRQTHIPLPFTPSKDELRTAVTTEAERYAVFNDCEALVDLISFGQEDQGLKVLFAAIRQDVANSYLKTFAAAGMTPLSLEPLSLASLRKIMEFLPNEASGLMLRGQQNFAIACWQEERLQVWRELEAWPDTEELAIEVLRTVGHRRPESWVLFGPSKEEATQLSEHLRAPVTWIDAERNSQRFTEGLLSRDGLIMDLRPPVEQKKSLLTHPKFWVAAGMTLGLVTLLAFRLALEFKLADAENRLKRTQQQLTIAQRAAAMPNDPLAEAQSQGMVTYQEGIRRIQLFKQLRDTIPADTWFTSVKFEEKTFAIEGYSLSRQSPADLALSLQAWNLKVSPPSLTREDLEGDTVYRFKIQSEGQSGQR